MVAEKLRDVILRPRKLTVLRMPIVHRRNYMSNDEILKFKNRNNEEKYNKREYSEKINNEINNFKYSYMNEDLVTPFDIYKWSDILNTNNEKLISDAIKHEKNEQMKRKEVDEAEVEEPLSALLNINRILKRYGIIINENENDILVGNEIKAYFHNFLNILETNFENNDLIKNVIKEVKKNESHIFYYIYKNFMIIHGLPLKCFWKYDNIENQYNISNKHNQFNENGETFENEYLFQNVDINKIDSLLNEDRLDNIMKKNMDSNTQDFKHDQTLKNNSIRNTDSVDHHFQNSSGTFSTKYKFSYPFFTNITSIEPENTNSTNDNIYEPNNGSNYNIKRSNNQKLTQTYEYNVANNFGFYRDRKHLSTISSHNNINYETPATKKDNYVNPNDRKKYIKKNDANEKEDARPSTPIDGKVNEKSCDTYLFDKKIPNGAYEELNENNEETVDNPKGHFMVDETNFNYNISILNNKIKNNEKNEITYFRVSEVPVSPLSRAKVFGKVFFDIAKNTSIEYIKKKIISNEINNNQRDLVINEKNAEILANGLSKMRGVVLKLGQMISLQDECLSPILIKALKMVSNSADIMPKDQLIKVLKSELGENYESKFDYFDYKPFSSASIGQVHEGVINNKKVAIKIQYPGVYESIDSDIKNLLFINQYTNLILKNLYIENICKEIRKELICECDYINEAKYYVLFKNVFQKSKYFYVPNVYSEYVTKRVLVTSYVEGISLEKVAESYPQPIRDSIGQRILYLCLHELFVLKIMNTDPNLGNFIYNPEEDKLCLIDFGATRSYKNEFVDQYLRLVKSSVEENEDKIYHYSYMLNFFIGQENEDMKSSHIKSVILVGEPFKSKVYDFGNNDLAKNIYTLLPRIIYNRLVPPRSEIYTLHRKLSGSYLICMKLKARVNAADIFNSIYNNYVFSVKDTYSKKS
ncbi:ABC1 family, putative [Plasmodium berghei]|uniref:ABC1 family, putative n=2 Tax=Plasmodium berghei TaxID=5821 RepID=A0A509ARZ1_PLABA|nr:ABC1 family, putative [Plasmodium berghei ANKA]CXJ18332.1 ABC1 family, putative [Plasmodium berghei]SCM26423.1 ABC1 family, putative [Plasmodium berghei]SCN28448.1 ABC1 family, putative [Plasmodium berghei]SCO62641.1 ABC1 family, putative [Plasmodium berghei]SCO64202.1 ABC1 family, putative [Plasmodium berghei]|eukprot:XP_034424096.1 ABC1 family, putative [Plasmodium berghei ANKA]